MGVKPSAALATVCLERPQAIVGDEKAHILPHLDERLAKRWASMSSKTLFFTRLICTRMDKKPGTRTLPSSGAGDHFHCLLGLWLEKTMMMMAEMSATSGEAAPCCESVQAQ